MTAFPCPALQGREGTGLDSVGEGIVEGVHTSCRTRRVPVIPQPGLTTMDALGDAISLSSGAWFPTWMYGHTRERRHKVTYLSLAEALYGAAMRPR